jgi:hypothetical protein
LIAPSGLGAGQPERVWREQPLFLWQGDLERLEITDAQQRVVWRSGALWSENGQVVYGGEPLEPGQVYQLTVYQGAVATLKTRFERVSVAEQMEIKAGLQKLEQALKQNGRGAEDLALARVNYFAQQGLWMDAYAEAESHKTRFEGIAKYQEQAIRLLCK